MRIWYISKYAGAPGAQAGERGPLLLEALANLGHEVFLVTSSSNRLQKEKVVEAEDFRVPARILHAPTYRRAQSFSRLASWFFFDLKVCFLKVPAGRVPEVIIGSSPSLLTMASARFLSRRYGTLFVVELRDLWPLNAVEEFGYSRKNPLVLFADLLEKSTLKVADGVIGMVPGFSNYLSSRVPNPPPSAVVPIGVPDSRYTRRRASVEPKESSDFVVGYAGSIGLTNSLDTLMEAASILMTKSDIRFDIFGDGDELAQLREKWSHLSMVNFHGRVDKDQLEEKIKKCSVLYFGCRNTRVWSYGQSLNKVVEYMLSSRPIVASYSGKTSMIDEAGSGFFVEAEDSEALAEQILKMSRMPERDLRLMGTKGFDWIMANRGYKVLAQDLETFLNSLRKRTATPQ